MVSRFTSLIHVARQFPVARTTMTIGGRLFVRPAITQLGRVLTRQNSNERKNEPGGFQQYMSQCIETPLDEPIHPSLDWMELPNFK